MIKAKLSVMRPGHSEPTLATLAACRHGDSRAVPGVRQAASPPTPPGQQRETQHFYNEDVEAGPNLRRSRDQADIKADKYSPRGGWNGRAVSDEAAPPSRLK